uniref:DNA mismatch repair proteins mutS family domain-containing protein n=1 Tax=Amorphochlora amoebiformis TaxID=1561963 RepID=A0A7S0GJU7_9EUKA
MEEELPTASKKRKRRSTATPQSDKKPRVVPSDSKFHEVSTLDHAINNPDSVELSHKRSAALLRAKCSLHRPVKDDTERVSAYKSWKFLDPKYRRDKNKKRPGDPNYDSNSVYIEEAYYKKMTPAERQYWRMKKDNMDFILFFKMGKFYELFDDDADIGARELGFNYMSGKRRHTGFPEGGFDKYASEFVKLGYKIARVEQMETPKELKERNKQRKARGQRVDPVVRREMLQVLTPGTVSDENLIGHEDANYTISLCEEKDIVGVCFVDTSRLRIFVGQFSDDHFRSRLRTLLAQLNPTEVVYPQGSLCKRTQLILRNDLKQKVGRNPLVPGLDFWDAETTWMQINDADYFKDKTSGFPEVLKMIRETNQSVASSALGGLLHYLRKVMIDAEQFSAGSFYHYQVSDPRYAHNMILDAQTLENLEILRNDEGGKKGSLLAHIDKTVTAFGKRLITEWLIRPLIRKSDINERLAAVDELMSRPEDARNIAIFLKRLPDLERLLVRIHVNSIASDRGAVMYENVNAKKIKQFLTALKGFGDAVRAIQSIDEPFESKTLHEITTVGKSFPDIEDTISRFDNSFDKSEAKDRGFIIPNKGVNKEYDAVEESLTSLKRGLDKFLRETRSRFGDRSIKYKHLGKERYQLEISCSTVKKKQSCLPSNWMLAGSSKKVKKYIAPEVRKMVEQLGEAEFEREKILKDVSRAMFADFCTEYPAWKQAVSCLAQLDCLISLAIVSMDQTPSARPEFLDGEESCVEIRDAVHPTIASSAHMSTSTFIPNDIVIGTSENEAKFILVSGPNMGGKSTLLRQACITVILAQVGCYVPAESCRLTPVDRIFTRVGANDRIMQGQSTFMVELQETGNILKHASKRSLVILDELGRGTSTFDGTAIAYSVIKYLMENTKCMTLFSTHYHKLLDEFKTDNRVAMYHMACKVEKEAVTFLYKFTKGICSNSYGMNCASLAGMPGRVVKRARDMAEHFKTCLELAHGKSKLSKASFVASILQALASNNKQLSSLQRRISAIK